VKLAQQLGVKKVIGYTRRFGISERIPPYLPVALGAVELTLLEHTSAFSTFPMTVCEHSLSNVLRKYTC
jgi:penicillin-binding protein 1A